MHSNLKKGLVLLTVIGAISLPGIKAEAKETESCIQLQKPIKNIETVVNSCSLQNVRLNIEEYLEPLSKGEYLDMVFANVDDFIYIRSEASEESEYVGKMYQDNAAHIVEDANDWILVESGEVRGYVKKDEVIKGPEAVVYAGEIAEESESEEDPFAYAESREQEEERIRLEEERRRAEEEAAALARRMEAGQAVADFACQFIGNPYVYGGTSLTNGTDCSGFVQSVYRNFGISLPRTSGAQRGAGVGVSYSEAIPGDVICYSGHVGIYIGNGQIVNALNPSQGIRITPANYAPILSVRRMM